MANKRLSDLSTYTSPINGSEIILIQNGTDESTKITYSNFSKSSSLYHSHSFSEILNKPTTLSGYGITDSITLTSYQTDSSSFLSEISNKLNTSDYQTDSSSFLSEISNKLNTSDYQVDSASFLSLIEAGGGGGSGVTDILQSDLRTAITNGTLTPGSKYKITDFQLMWWSAFQYAQATAKSSSVIEPLIVTATTTSSISPIALSCLHPFDIIYYDATSSYSTGWGNKTTPISGFKGWIYRRIDTKRRVDIGWDWRYITNTCAKYDISDVPEWNSGTTYGEYTVDDPSNIVQYQGKIYYSISGSGTNLNHIPSDITNTWWQSVSDTVEANTYYPTHDVVFLDFNVEFYEPGQVLETIELPTFVHSDFTYVGQSTSERTDTFLHDVYIKKGFNNVIYLPSASQESAGFNDVEIGNEFEFNTIKFAFCDNKISDRFVGNVIGSGFSGNTISDTFEYNSIHAAFGANDVKHYFSTNTIGQLCVYNNFGSDFQSNVISTDFQRNNIGTYYLDNVIRKEFQFNTIGSLFRQNFVAPTMQFNTIANSVTGNTFIKNSKYNNILDSFNNQDFTGGTHVTGSYNTTCFKNSAGTNRLSYINASDALTIVNPNA